MFYSKKIFFFSPKITFYKKSIAVLCWILLASYGFGQNILTLINQCPKVQGDVVSTTEQVVEYQEGGFEYRTAFVHIFNEQNQLVSMQKYNNESEEIQRFDYIYGSNNTMTKLTYKDSRTEKLLFIQYKEGLPTKIRHTSLQEELLSLSSVYADSLNRPFKLENYNPNNSLRYVQLVKYEENSNRFLIQNNYFEYPNIGQTRVFEYFRCSETIFLDTIHKAQFEDSETKVLNLTVEKNKATIVKVVNPNHPKNEQILIQDIVFDEQENWISNKIYRLKKRRQKKVLLQEIQRTIVYR